MNIFSHRPLNAHKHLNFLTRAVSILYFCMLSTTTVAQTVPDVDAPVLEHSVIETGAAGDDQEFVATVTDNVAVESVTLFYKFRGQDNYSSVEMKPDENNQYRATISTEPDMETNIQYYINAEDTAGTSVSRGLAFNPLEREIVIMDSLQLGSDDSLSVEMPTQGTQDLTAQQTNESLDSSSRPKTWQYAIGGLLLVGLLLGAGGDGGSGTPSECVNENCMVTINVTAPTN